MARTELLSSSAKIVVSVKSDVDCTSIISNTQEATVIVRPVLDVLKGYNSPSSLSGSPGNSNHSTGDIPGEITKMLTQNTVDSPSTPVISKLPEIDFASRRSLLRYKCEKCGRECPSKHKLKRHLSTHSEARPFPCSICGRTFKWTEYLQKHMRQQHPLGKRGKCCGFYERG